MSTQARHRAFTLIELLVVVSIISLLIALLLPALGKARDAARTSQCLGNLRQISIGSVNYGLDFRQYFAPTKIENYWAVPSGGNFMGVFSDPPFLGGYTGNGRPAINGRNINGFVAETKLGVWFCPADTFNDNNVNFTRRIISYAQNNNYSTINLISGKNEWYIYRQDDMPEPARMAHLVDGEREWFPGNGSTGNCFGIPDGQHNSGVNDTPGGKRNYRVRHGQVSDLGGGAANVAFLDGHARTSPDLRREKIEGKVRNWKDPSKAIWIDLPKVFASDDTGNATDL